jgi:hypothetical protein
MTLLWFLSVAAMGVAVATFGCVLWLRNEIIRLQNDFWYTRAIVAEFDCKITNVALAAGLEWNPQIPAGWRKKK